MSEFKWRRSLIMATVILSGALGAGTGCKHNDASEMDMAPDKLKAIQAADAVYSNGEKEKAQGLQMQKDGKDPESADKMIKQGESDMARGQALLDNAKMMK